MKSPISIATRGRIAQTSKKTLTLATIGWLVFSSTPPPPYTPTKPKKKTEKETGLNVTYLPHEFNLAERIKKDDNEILEIIKIFLKCQE